jgi:hypothetical protein
MLLRLSLVAALSLAVGCATTTPANGTGTPTAAVQSGDSCDMHHKKEHAHADGKACDCAGKAEEKACCKGEQKGDCCKGKDQKPEGACGCGKKHEDGKACDCGGKPEQKADCGCGSAGACGGSCTAEKGCGCGGAKKAEVAPAGCGCQHG